MQKQEYSLFRSCPRCREELLSDYQFCPKCGLNLERAALLPALRLKHLICVLAVAAGLWGSAWSMQSVHAGKKPSAKFEEQIAGLEDNNAIVQLRSAAESNPGNKQGWMTLASHLMFRMNEQETPPAALALEAIDALSKVLSLDPKDSQALRMMADVSFSRQAFPKAVEFYERYLALVDDDLDVRTRLGSAYTFNAQHEKGIAELEKVLAKNPKHFQAMAYLAVAYLQAGNREKALEIGERSLAIAPSEDARARFSAFLDSVKNGSVRADVDTPERGTKNMQKLPPIAALSESIKANPVAGPKFSHLELLANGAVAMYFHDFPMSAMPPFAKDKFLGGIKGKIKELNITEARELSFVDLGSGKEMERVKLR